MNRKIQSIALALGGAITILAMAFGKIEWSWIGFLYTALATIIGFINWIELDKTHHTSNEMGAGESVVAPISVLSANANQNNTREETKN